MTPILRTNSLRDVQRVAEALGEKERGDALRKTLESKLERVREVVRGVGGGGGGVQIGYGQVELKVLVDPSVQFTAPKLQSNPEKEVGPGVPTVGPNLKAHESIYSHGSPVPSTLISPNVSITLPFLNSSIASSPFWDILLEAKIT